jgi:hypothetical protein
MEDDRFDGRRDAARWTEMIRGNESLTAFLGDSFPPIFSVRTMAGSGGHPSNRQLRVSVPLWPDLSRVLAPVVDIGAGL